MKKKETELERTRQMKLTSHNREFPDLSIDVRNLPGFSVHHSMDVALSDELKPLFRLRLLLRLRLLRLRLLWSFLVLALGSRLCLRLSFLVLALGSRLRLVCLPSWFSPLFPAFCISSVSSELGVGCRGSLYWYSPRAQLQGRVLSSTTFHRTTGTLQPKMMAMTSPAAASQGPRASPANVDRIVGASVFVCGPRSTAWALALLLPSVTDALTLGLHHRLICQVQKTSPKYHRLDALEEVAAGY